MHRFLIAAAIFLAGCIVSAVVFAFAGYRRVLNAGATGFGVVFPHVAVIVATVVLVAIFAGWASGKLTH